MTEQKLTITGMSCAACVGRVETALRSAPGVERADVNLATNEATVSIADGAIALDDLIASVESAGYGVAADSLTLTVDGMTCAACQSRVAGALEAVPGVAGVSVNLATGEATVEHRGADRHALRRAVEQAGYAVAAESARTEPLDETGPLTRRFVVAAALSGAIMALMPYGRSLGLSEDAIPLLLLALAAPVQFWCGWPFLTGFVSAVRHGAANMNSLIAVGTLSAFGYSAVAVAAGPPGTHLYFDTAAMIITFVLLGRLLEHRARRRTSDAIRALTDLQPETARVIRDGEPVELAVEQVVVGDRVLIRPGDRIPVDGTILEGRSAVDESLITGESMPVDRVPGDAVVGGSINRTGSFEFEATGVGADTALARITDLVRKAQTSRPPIQRLADRIAAIFVPVIFGVAAVTFAGWWWAGGSFAEAMINAVAVLIISCPCALGLATPTAILVGTGKGAELGLLVRSGDVVETAQRIRTVVLDKTGTVTHGRPAVTDVIPAEGFTEARLLELAGSLERNSEHPIGVAVVEEARRRGIDLTPPDDFEATVGAGVRGRVTGSDVWLGNGRMMKAAGCAADEVAAEALREGGKTVIHAAVDGSYAGLIAVADEVREESAEAIAALKQEGMEVALLTGDNTRTAEAVARLVGIDLVVAEVRPEDKANRISALQEQRGVVAMVGDGVNDAPALAQADVGIAIGTGTDVAIESADIALMSGDLRGVPAIIRLSARTVRIIRQNLFWAFAYNVLLVPVAALGLLNPWGGPSLAAAAMAFSSVTVVANALRLKRFDPRRARRYFRPFA